VQNEKAGIYWETWNTLQCPYCDALNWICQGDINDCSALDIEACQCHKCDKKFWLSEHTKEEYFFDNENATIDDAYCRKGVIMIKKTKE